MGEARADVCAQVDEGEEGVNCGYCRDCKWWRDFHRPRTYDKEPPREWLACHRALNHGGQWEDGETRAIATDYEDYIGALFTAPDFGCVQFEAKEGVNGQEVGEAKEGAQVSAPNKPGWNEGISRPYLVKALITHTDRSENQEETVSYLVVAESGENAALIVSDYLSFEWDSGNLVDIVGLERLPYHAIVQDDDARTSQ